MKEQAIDFYIDLCQFNFFHSFYNCLFTHLWGLTSEFCFTYGACYDMPSLTSILLLFFLPSYAWGQRWSKESQRKLIRGPPEMTRNLSLLLRRRKVHVHVGPRVKIHSAQVCSAYVSVSHRCIQECLMLSLWNVFPSMSLAFCLSRI